MFTSPPVGVLDTLTGDVLELLNVGSSLAPSSDDSIRSEPHIPCFKNLDELYQNTSHSMFYEHRNHSEAYLAIIGESITEPPTYSATFRSPHVVGWKRANEC